MLHLDAANDPVRVGGECDRRQGADHRGGDADSLELFGYRWAATMAAPSPRHLERRRDARVPELLGDAPADRPRGPDRRLVADRAVDPGIDAADRALRLQR